MGVGCLFRGRWWRIALISIDHELRGVGSCVEEAFSLRTIVWRFRGTIDRGPKSTNLEAGCGETCKRQSSSVCEKSGKCVLVDVVRVEEWGGEIVGRLGAPGWREAFDCVSSGRDLPLPQGRSNRLLSRFLKKQWWLSEENQDWSVQDFVYGDDVLRFSQGQV